MSGQILRMPKRFLSILLVLVIIYLSLCGANFTLAKDSEKEQGISQNLKTDGTNRPSPIPIYVILPAIVSIIFIIFIIFYIIYWIYGRVKELKELGSRLSTIEWRLGSIESKANTAIQDTNSLILKLKAIEEKISQRPQTPTQERLTKIQNDLIRPKEDPLQVFCRFYNTVVEESNRRGEFIQRYQPVRFGVANAMERHRDPNIEPVFETASHGDYYAVKIKGNNLYAVVPRFDLTLDNIIYGPGAMGLVFDCHNYNPQFQYRQVKLIKPALFEPDAAKQRWTLIEKGELDLGQGE